jgi:hypothetical protein
MAGYALGLNVRDYRGRRLLQHTGGLPGYVSKVALIPELRLGVAVLTNQESGAAFEAIVYHVLDHYLGAKAPGYPAVFDRMVKKNLADVHAKQGKEAAARDSTSGPSLPLDRYAGTYRDPWYGDVTVAREGPGLVIRFTRSPSLVGDLVHWQHDGFLARWARPRAAGRCLRHLLAQPRRVDRAASAGAQLPSRRFQLRFPGPRPAAGEPRLAGKAVSL